MQATILKPIKKEIEIASNHISIEVEKHEVVDYKNRVCVKPWGHEFLPFLNKKVGIWCLTVHKNQSTSLHCHYNKDTLLITLSGCAKINLINNEVRYLNTFESIFIPRRKFHGISSFSESSCILEIEIYSDKVDFTDKNDLLRIDDKYKRKPVGYESSVQLITENLEKYGHFNLLEAQPVSVNGTMLALHRISSEEPLDRKGGYCILLEGSVREGQTILKEGSLLSGTHFHTLDTSCLILTLDNIEWKENAKIIHGMEHFSIVKKELKEQKKTIVLTSGCFDILHVGHLETLKQAKALGDILVVCLSSDTQIKLLKGNARPINTFSDRLNLFKTIACVDYIVPYEEENIEREETLGNIMKELDPDLWVKGSDYTVDAILDKHPYLRDVKLIPLLQDRSTTNIVKKIAGES